MGEHHHSVLNYHYSHITTNKHNRDEPDMKHHSQQIESKSEGRASNG